MPSSEELLRQLLHGVVARGYPWSGEGPVDLTQTPLHGYVQLLDEGVIEFEAIDDTPLTGTGDPFSRAAPAAVALSTPLGGAVMVDVRPAVGFTLQMGNARESVVQLRSDSLLFGLDIGALDGLSLLSVTVRFEGLGAWAGLRSLRATPSSDADGRLTGLTVSVGGAAHSGRQEATHRLPGPLRLAMDEHWAYTENTDGGLSITTALELELSALRPHLLRDYLTPILDVQDLLSTLYRGWVAASPGRVELKHYPLETQPLLWHRIAMHRSPRAIALPKSRNVMFAAREIGGVQGVARWVDLCASHRSAVDAVSAVYREGPESAGVHLLKLGAAIEQYVGSQARSAKWASKKNATSFELALARHVGRAPFAKWSGDPAKWADRFHHLYLGAKHHRPGAAPSQEVDLFARGGRWLMLAALFDRLACNRKPSTAIFTSGRNESVGRFTRRSLGLP